MSTAITGTRFSRSRLAAIAGALTVSIAPALHAQSIMLPAAGYLFARAPLPLRGSSFKPNWINRADCRADETLTVPLTLSNYSAYTLEAWVGVPSSTTNCGDISARTGSNPSCWLVFRQPPTASLENNTLNAVIRARDIVGQRFYDQGGEPPSVPIAPESVCENTSSTSEPVVIDFMFLTGTTVQGPVAEWTDVGFDITPPDPPAGVSAGQGDTRLALSWTPSASSDLYQYDFFCQPTSDTQPPRYYEASVASPAGGPGDANAPQIEDASASDGGPSELCAPTLLLPGSDPEAHDFSMYDCGTATGQSTAEGTASGLTDDVKYAVSIAGVDDLQNVGLLSNTTCGTPVHLTDFWSLYKDLGGKGGGGFCAIAAPRRGVSSSTAALSVLSVLGLMIRRNRRARTSGSAL